ncbi:MAG: ABC transporter ATP-binding protein [Alphaproteobacteria bacterium]
MPVGGAAAVVLRLTGVSKRFGPVIANDAIDLVLHRGEVLALLGENGAGKTTLMSILFGHYVADIGTVDYAAADGTLVPLRAGSPAAALEAGIGMVHQHFTLADNLSAFDNITLGSEPLWRARRAVRAARAKLQGLMEGSGLTVDLDVPVARLSVGERQRVEILKALYRDARILILDEPTAVLTPQEADQLFAILRRLLADGLAVIFISHKLGEVLAISDRVMVMRRGRVVAETPTREADAPRLAGLMVGEAVAEPKRTPQPPQAPVLEIERVSLRSGDGRTALEDATLTVHGGEIVGIAGVSGNGQAALSELVSGLGRPAAGSVRLNGAPAPVGRPGATTRAGVGRIPEDRHRDGAIADMTLWENAIIEQHAQPRFGRLGILRRREALRHADRLIVDYDIRCPGPHVRTGLLSGGNMQKLILGRVMAVSPRLVLANQPTRGLDVGAVAYVHGQLLAARARGGAVLLISEDLDELMQLSDRIAVIYRGRLTAARATETLTRTALGLMMAGRGDGAADAA